MSNSHGVWLLAVLQLHLGLLVADVARIDNDMLSNLFFGQ